MKNEEIKYETNDNGQIIIETVELSVKEPKAGTIIKVTDPSGFDQTPVPEYSLTSDKYAIGKTELDGVEREEIYWKDYATLVYYPDVIMQKGEKYTVFGRIQAEPGYVFADPVNMIVNGEELSSQEVEDYTLEGDSFCFYYDIKAV